MNSEMMCEYVKYVSNHLCMQLIDRNVYEHINNPWKWMILNSTVNKTNFFESRHSSYAKSSLITSKDETEIKFNENF